MARLRSFFQPSPPHLSGLRSSSLHDLRNLDSKKGDSQQLGWDRSTWPLHLCVRLKKSRPTGGNYRKDIDEYGYQGDIDLQAGRTKIYKILDPPASMLQNRKKRGSLWKIETTIIGCIQFVAEMLEAGRGARLTQDLHLLIIRLSDPCEEPSQVRPFKK
jgi:hypothetical protein